MTVRHPLLCLVVGLLFLSGCASSQYGEQITTVHYYPRCYAPINDLRQADKDFNKNVAGGAVGGALIGALVGYLATGKAEGAAIGAGAGAVVGTGVGYAKAKQERIADDNRRMASYLVDIDGDISGIDRATAAARVSRDCYEREFQQAVADFKAQRISREDLTRRYQEIKDGSTEASNILGSVIASTTEKEQQYQQAISEEAQKANKPVPVVAAKADPAPAKPSTTEPRKASNASAKATAPSPAQSPPASVAKTSAKRTPAPKKGDTSLEAVAQNNQRLNESKRDAQDEQELIRQMQAEMDGTLATLTS